MVNILPEDIRKRARDAARARYMIAGAIVALIAAGLALLLLLPSYFVLAGIPSLGSSTSITAAQVASDTAAVIETKVLLAAVAPSVAASSTPTAAIVEALGLRPQGVTVDQISYTAGTPSSLMLVGTAATTGSIGDYRTALAADPLFASVSVPVGALVGTQGGRFSITLSVAAGAF